MPHHMQLALGHTHGCIRAKETCSLIVQGVVFNEMRSKTKVIQKPVTSLDPKEFPDWSFDGSSTGQAEGNNSDCILKCAPPQTATPVLPVLEHAMCHA